MQQLKYIFHVLLNRYGYINSFLYVVLLYRLLVYSVVPVMDHTSVRFLWWSRSGPAGLEDGWLLTLS